MSTGRRKILVAGIGLVVGLAAILFFGLRAYNKDEAVRATIEWARLAPLPSSARDLVVTVKGSMFTREFVITFEAPSEDVERWLRESPGPAETTAQITPEGDTHYQLKPGGGAVFAEITVSADGTKVKIHAYWS